MTDHAAPESTSNRRSFLRSTSIVAPAAALIGAASLASPAMAARPNPRARKLPELYTGWNARNFQEIRADENTHVTTIVNALGALARPKPTFQNLQASNVQQFAVMSNVFENVGVSAYLAATPYIFDKTILSTAASIALVEAFHSGYLNTLLNNPIVPDSSPFAGPLSQAEVIQKATPYIASLNGGPVPAFDTTPSATNDIAILNFALALEYLEAEFYNINVPIFFG